VPKNILPIFGVRHIPKWRLLMGRKEQFLLKNAAYTRLSTCPRTRFPILAFSKSVQSGRFWRPFSKIRIRQICVDGKRIGNVYVFTIQTNSDMGSRSRSQAISQFLPQASSLLYISLHCTDIRAYIYVTCPFEHWNFIIRIRAKTERFTVFNWPGQVWSQRWIGLIYGQRKGNTFKRTQLRHWKTSRCLAIVALLMIWRTRTLIESYISFWRFNGTYTYFFFLWHFVLELLCLDLNSILFRLQTFRLS
jgi:hypothetical protein